MINRGDNTDQRLSGQHFSDMEPYTLLWSPAKRRFAPCVLCDMYARIGEVWSGPMGWKWVCRTCRRRLYYDMWRYDPAENVGCCEGCLPYGNVMYGLVRKGGVIKAR